MTFVDNPSWHYILLYHHSHHRDNVTSPHRRPNLRSRLHFCHAQEGGPRSPQGHVVGIVGGRGGGDLYHLYTIGNALKLEDPDNYILHFTFYSPIYSTQYILHVTLLSRLAQSGRWSSFRKQVWFTESHIVLVISFLLMFYLFLLFLV